MSVLPRDAVRTTDVVVDGSGRRATPPIANYLFLGSAVAALLVLAVSAMTIWQSYRDTLVSSQRSAENLLQSVIGYMDQHMRLYALALGVAAEMLQGAKADGMSEHAKLRILKSIAGSSDYVGSVMELDASGRLVRSSHPTPPGLDFSDRDYFQAQLNTPDLGVYISTPFHSRLREGMPSFALSRKLLDQEGRFKGVVVIAVSLGYIEAFMSGIDMGPKGVLLMISANGRILSRQPAHEGRGAIGTDLSKEPVFQRMQQMGQGSFVAISGIDGIERHYTFARVLDQPMFVNVAFASEDIFRNWRKRSAVIAAVALLTCALILLLAIVLRIELCRRAAVESDLARLSLTDDLTGLANRRRYDEALKREWLRSGRTGRPLALLMLDVDEFKKFNDAYGHAQGDRVLVALGRVIREALSRPADLGARYGGEEFAIVLPDTDEQGALRVAERIRAACEGLDAGLPPFTVSIGIKVAQPAAGLSPAIFQEEADRALYRAKRLGRNRVELAA